MAKIFDLLDTAKTDAPLLLGPGSLASTRLHTLLADGSDLVAAQLALAKGWELISPLPFGSRLNLAINATPVNASDARRLIAGEPAHDEATQSRAEKIQYIASQAVLFELADKDDVIEAQYLAMLDDPDDFAKAKAFDQENARRARLAGRILIEQSDILIAIWDGASTSNIGGTGHTVALALNQGAAVIWINPADPEDWQILQTPEALAVLWNCHRQQNRDELLSTKIRDIICPTEASLSDQSRAHRGLAALAKEQWRDRSNRLMHAYRRIESVFGGDSSPFRSLVKIYEKPEDISAGTGAPFINAAKILPNVDESLAQKIDIFALQNFAWADGISAQLSDHYRAGMTINFLLSALAIVGGILYLPLVGPELKWGFAFFEFLLLLAIVIITYRGRKYRWHGRWFETRRVAEYFRHSPIMVMFGVARPPGRWPKGTETSWPEWYVRQALRDIGLPPVTITSVYLRLALNTLKDFHIAPQRDYHRYKAKRLKMVHHNLDKLSETFFKLALLSVALYLIFWTASLFHFVDVELVTKSSKIFTVLGVLFPTFGGAIAGIRFFGDFERFAAISEVTAEKLDVIHSRITTLLTASDDALDYGRATELVHATDDVVIAEIENWQAVFGGKNITVPV